MNEHKWLLKNLSVGTLYISLAGLVVVPVVAQAKAQPKVRQGVEKQQKTDTRQKDIPGNLDGASTTKLGTITVTAQKRVQPLQDVPIPITVINTGLLAQTNRVKLEDVFAAVPGLSLNVEGNGQTSIAIRGITTGGLTSPTVGITIDGIPFGASTLLSYGSRYFPDLDPVNLSQIEVLRGPQGTLDGVSSLGGLINFKTLDPDTSSFFGHVEVDGSAVHGGGRGYGVRGSVNVPVSKTFAARVGVLKRQDPGYVDDPTQGRSNVNRSTVKGGLVSALWIPSDAFTLKLGALSQETTGYGTSLVETNDLLQPTIGDLKQDRILGSGYHSIKAQLYSAIATVKMTNMELTSLTGYGISQYRGKIDNSLKLGAAAERYFGVSGSILDNRFKTDKFSQELRLQSSGMQFLQWLVGGFYTKEDTAANQRDIAIDPADGRPVGVIVHFPFPTTYKEYAVYGDLTLHFTDRLDIQVGARRSHMIQTYSEVDTGPLVGGTFVNPSSRITGNSTTFLLTPRFKASSNLMVYMRVASGYRAGGPNADASLFGLPLAYKPDKTVNYEVGVKSNLFNHTVLLDGSIYYIDWTGIQLQQLDPATGIKFFTNGGKAKSEGAEVALKADVGNGLRVVASATYDHAVLADDLPSGAGIGMVGDRLPYSSKWAGSLSLNQNYQLAPEVTGVVGARGSYVGGRYGNFASALGIRRSYMPAYIDLSAHVGLEWSGTWRATLFVRNLTNKRGVLYAEPLGPTHDAPFGVNYIQPRTVGISITKFF